MRAGLAATLVGLFSSLAYCAEPIEGETPRAEAIKANFAKLVSEDKEVKREALLYFGKVDKTFATEVPFFTTSLTDKRYQVRAISAYALGKIGGAAVGAIPGVEKLLSDSSAAVQKYAKRALERLRSFKLDPKKPAPEKAAAAQGAARKWTSRYGKNSVVAKLMEVNQDGIVILQRANGSALRFPFSELSQVDLEYLKSTNEYKNYFKESKRTPKRTPDEVKILREWIKMSAKGRRVDLSILQYNTIGSKITDADLVHLKGLTNLEWLDLERTNVTDAGLVHLKELTSLQYLHLNITRVADGGLVYLKGLTNLKNLDLSRTEVTDAGLVHLKGLTKLQYLGLRRTWVTDAGLVHLKGLTNLQKLGLDYTRVITDAGLVHMKGLTSLQYLDLAETKVTDAGLEHLKGLTSLKRLHLNNTKVTDAGLVHLKGLTNLEALPLNDTKVTDAGVKKLKQALPDCEIKH